MKMQLADPVDRGALPASARSTQEWLWIALLVLVTAAPYLPTLGYGFVYDDRPQIVDNRDLGSLANIPKFFGQSVTKAVGFHNTSQPVFYRPLFFSQLCITRAISGPGPFGFHLLSLLVHLVNTLLIYFTALRLGVRKNAAYLAGMLFAVHPVHVESVVWPSASPELMVLGGILSSVLAFQLAEEGLSKGARVGWRAASLAAFLLALFVKETAFIILPLVAAVSLFRSSPGISKIRRLVMDLAPFGGLAVFYLAVRAHVLHGMVATVTPASWMNMARTWPSVLWFYERHLFMPAHTSLLYDYDLVEHLTAAAFWIPLAAVLGTLVVSGFVLGRARSLAVAIAALLIVLPIVLVLNFRIFYWGDLVHDRYLYTPSAGFCVLAAMALCAAGERFSKFVSPFVQKSLAAALVGGMALLAIAQAQPWRNNLLLLANAAKVAPGNIAAQILLGDELEGRHNFLEAKICYERALALTPGWGPAWFAYGRTLLLTDDADGAIGTLQHAIRLDDSAIARVWLAAALEEAGRRDEARVDLSEAIARDPSMREAYADVRKKVRSADRN